MTVAFLTFAMIATASGYVVSPPPAPPPVPVEIVQPALERPKNYKIFPETTMQQSDLKGNTVQQVGRQPQRQRISYDLGIGKNAPVGFIRSNAQPNDDDTARAVQYWDHHQTVNEYPNPEVVAQARSAMLDSSSSQEGPSSSTEQQTPTKRRKSQNIVPERFSGEQFPITNQQAVPTIAARESVVRQHDLNTAWVEMLIHEQQVKFA